MATKKKKTLDHARLARLADQIASYPHARAAELIPLLKELDGLKMAEVPKGSGVHRASMAGISAQSTGGPVNALINWGNKARRVVASAA